MRSVIKEVETEYGQPFWDVVRGYAADGHSLNSTAEMLGYASANPLRRLIQRRGVTIQFASAQESVFQKEARESRRGVCTEAQKVALQAAKAANPVYIYLEHAGVRDTIAGHSRRADMSVSTARKRYARNQDPAYVFAKKSYRVAPPSGLGWQAEGMKPA